MSIDAAAGHLDIAACFDCGQARGISQAVRRRLLRTAKAVGSCGLRLAAYAEAGADGLYAPGLKTKKDIAAVVKALHPKPVNVLIGSPGSSVQELADFGFRRISIGGTLARVAWGGFLKRRVRSQTTVRSRNWPTPFPLAR